MNGKMWSNPATSHNVTTLRERGFVVLDPVEGQLASHGEQGRGRLIEPSDLLAVVERTTEAKPSPTQSHSSRLDGLNILISAGGTREPIDGVRFLGNRSSGRMGLALAKEAAERGAAVKFVVANSQIQLPTNFESVEVQTADEMSKALETRFPAADILIMAAAVADFRPIHASKEKIDKSAGVPNLQLEAVPDIVSGLAASKRPGQLVVGFAAEHGLNVDRAREKLVRKRLDLIVFNDISNPAIGFDSSRNAVTIITAKQIEEVPENDKDHVASVILDRIEMLLG